MTNTNLDVKKVVLNNGLKIIFVKNNRKSIVSELFVKAGSIYENESQLGISHFVEHLLFEGTKNRTALEISKEIESVGGDMNAWTSDEYTAYYVHISSHYAKRALSILQDITFNSVFSQEAIEKEREIILSEYNEMFDDPDSYKYYYFEKALFNGTIRAKQPIGSIECIKNITRDDLLSYHKEMYVPQNMTLVITGPYDENFMNQCISTFNVEKRDSTVKELSFNPIIKSLPKSIITKNLVQSHILYGFSLENLSFEDLLAIKVIDAYIGKPLSGRLYQELRLNNPYAYYNTTLFSFESYYGYWGYNIVCDKKNVEPIIALLASLTKELATLTDENIKESLAYLLGKEDLLMDDGEYLASKFAYYEFLGGYEHYNFYIQSLKCNSEVDISILREKIALVVKKLISPFIQIIE